MELIAYIDPGSGAFILQLLAGAVLGALFIFKSWWYGVLNFFRKMVGKEPLDMPSKDDDDAEIIETEVDDVEENIKQAKTGKYD